jgi:hypothetical protein
LDSRRNLLKDTRIIKKLLLYKELDIVADTEIKILDLISHILSMDHEIVLRTIFKSKPVGGRTMGRPRMRWLEGARKEIRETKVKIWRQKAVNRADWTSVIKEANVNALRGQ